MTSFFTPYFDCIFVRRGNDSYYMLSSHLSVCKVNIPNKLCGRVPLNEGSALQASPSDVHQNRLVDLPKLPVGIPPLPPFDIL